jgi:DNA replication initiation complex subunit (GINS family)
MSRPSGVDPETVKTVRLYFKDLVSLRLSKLIGYASKGVDPDLVQRMTDEERELYLRLRDVIGVWLSSLGLEV